MEHRGVNQEGDRRVVLQTALDDTRLDPNHIYVSTRDEAGKTSLRVKLTSSLALQVAKELIDFSEAQARNP